MRVQEVSVYIDFKTDESYTPKAVAIKVGNAYHEMQEVKMIDFDEPVGWFTFQLQEKNPSTGAMIKPYIKTMFVQL